MPSDILFQLKAQDQTGDAFSAVERRVQQSATRTAETFSNINRQARQARATISESGAVQGGLFDPAPIMRSEKALEDFYRLHSKLQIVLRAENEDYEDSNRGRQRAINRIRAEVEQRERLQAAYRRSTAGQIDLTRQIGLEVRLRKQLEDEYNNSARAIRIEQEQLKRRARAQHEASREIREATRNLRGWIGALQSAGRLRGAGTALQDLFDRWEVAETRGQRLRAVIPLIGGAALGLADDLGRLASRGFQQAIRDSVQLESSLVRLETQLGLTAEQSAIVEGQVRSLAIETARGAKDLADAAFFIQSTGLRGAEASQLLDITARGAAVGLGREADVARLTSAAINAYGSDTLSAAEAGEALIDTVREGALEAGELSASFGRLLAPASELGIEFQELGAAIAFYTRLGVSSAEAVTALRSTFEGILKPSTQARNILSRIGFTAETLQERVGERGLLATLREVRRELGNDITALTGFLGRQEAVGLVLALTGDRAQEAEDVLASLRGETGDLDRAFDRVSETTEFKFNRSLSQMREIGLRIGDRVLPVINSGLNAVAGVFDFFFGEAGPQLSALEQHVEGLVDDFERWVGLGDDKTRFEAERYLLRLLGDETVVGNAQAISRIVQEIVELGGDARGRTDIEEILTKQGEAVALAATELEAYEQKERELREELRKRRDSPGGARGVFSFTSTQQVERDLREIRSVVSDANDRLEAETLATLETLEQQGVVIDDLSTDWDGYSEAVLGALKNEQSAAEVVALRRRQQAEFRNELRESTRGLNVYNAGIDQTRDSTGRLVQDTALMERILRQVKTDTPREELRLLEEKYIAAGGAAEDFARYVAGLQDATDLFTTQKMRRELLAAAAALEYNIFVLSGGTQGRLPLPGNPYIDKLLEDQITLTTGQEILSALYSRTNTAAQKAGETEREASSTAASARNELNASIDASAAALAREQGILANTKREYQDFWTDARRESQYAVQDQQDALSRLERDAFQALEGLEGDARKLRELELRERLEDRKDALAAEAKEEERRVAGALEAAADAEDALRDAFDAAQRSIEEASDKAKEQLETVAETAGTTADTAITGVTETAETGAEVTTSAWETAFDSWTTALTEAATATGNEGERIRAAINDRVTKPWEDAKKAVDEYFRALEAGVLDDPVLNNAITDANLADLMADTIESLDDAAAADAAAGAAAAADAVVSGLSGEAWADAAADRLEERERERQERAADFYNTAATAPTTIAEAAAAEAAAAAFAADSSQGHTRNADQQVTAAAMAIANEVGGVFNGIGPTGPVSNAPPGIDDTEKIRSTPTTNRGPRTGGLRSAGGFGIPGVE